MAYTLDTHNRNYPNNSDLTQFSGESQFDYKARGTLRSFEQYSRLARLPDVHTELVGENYRGIEAELLYIDKYYDKIGRELI